VDTQMQLFNQETKKISYTKFWLFYSCTVPLQFIPRQNFDEMILLCFNQCFSSETDEADSLKVDSMLYYTYTFLGTSMSQTAK